MLPTLLLGVGLLAGCADVPPPAEGPSRVRAAAADPDLCAEHGVLESVCTQCNAALIPVFQSKGDWCDAHGFPESFCPVCSPEAEGRPVATDLSIDGSPADGVTVRFRTREAADLAGIEVAKAVEAPWAGGIEATARLAWDATRVAQVSPRSAGFVEAIAADVGTRVAAGDVLARLRSAHVAGDRSRRTAAAAALEVARADLARKQDLRDRGVTSEREVRIAEQAVAAARAELSALQSELGLVGGGAGDVYDVVSPLAGVVTERFASIGQAVDPSTPLFQVVDPSRMWAELDVPEHQLADVATGQAVHLVLEALPERSFAGTLDYLAPSVDPRTRTARGRVVLDNPDGALRAHLYGTAHVVTDATASVVTVPSAAVQDAVDVHLVFVRTAPDTFVGRRVQVLGRTGTTVHVAGPVTPGDPVATTGAFLLKTETLSDRIGAGCCDVE